jgi:hypothetical protein
MSYYLFLDDERFPHNVTWLDIPRDRDYAIVRSYDEFVAYIEANGLPDYVSFDHDLADAHYVAMLKEAESHEDTKFKIWMPGDDEYEGLNITVDYGPEKTGHDCAKWLVDYCDRNKLKFPFYLVHSMNPIGKQRIVDYITSAQKHLGI